MSDKKLCPFKRTVENKWERKYPKTVHSVSERFDFCAGTRCMAYYEENGSPHCKRLDQRKENIL